MEIEDDIIVVGRPSTPHRLENYESYSVVIPANATPQNNDFRICTAIETPIRDAKSARKTGATKTR